MKAGRRAAIDQAIKYLSILYIFASRRCATYRARTCCRARPTPWCAPTSSPDDIGTKVDPAKVKLQPSYKLETSPGNFQWGYLLTYGSDPAKAAALIQGLADAGLTDEGAKRADRVVRVPGSINEKPTLKEPFIARLVEKHWERTWTLSQLEVGFGVLSAEPRPALQIRALEAGETDPVFEWLQDDDRVLGGPYTLTGSGSPALARPSA
jgi:hypothetical protein